MTTTYLENIERENRAKAVGFTLVISVLVFLLFFYIKIFDFHDDPQYSSEIPVEFGTDNVGSGSVKTHNTPNNLKDATESAPPKITKIVPKPTPVVPKKVVEKVVPKAEPKVKTKVVPDPPVRTTTNESPVKVKDTPAKTTPTPSKPADNTTTGKVVEPKATPTPPSPPQPKVDEAGIMKSKGGNGTKGTSTNPGGNNNGDDNGKVGDKGQKDGGDVGVFKGKNGDGVPGGVALSLSGFKFSSRPQLKDPYDETGKIVFKIKVDDNGEIISLTVAETNVSSQVVNWYKQRLSQQAIIPTSDGQRPTTSSGTIYINIVSR